MTVELVPATPALVDDELKDPALLAERLGVELPADWPPEHHGERVLRSTAEALADPAAAGWWLHWFVASGDDGARVLVGTGGYKGPPDDGVVEVGYSVVPSWQRRGVATEAVRAFVAGARERGAHTVIAHTLPSLEPSIGVLRKLGFEPAESPEPGVIGFRLRLA